MNSGQTDSRSVRILYATRDEWLPPRVDRAADQATLQSEVVTTVSAALDAIESTPVDCVVVTDSFPDGDDLDLAREIRDVTATVPVVLATAGGDERARAAAAVGVTYLPTGSRSDDRALLAERVLSLAAQEHDRREAQQACDRLERTNHRLESLFESAPLPVVELDAEGTVLRWNHGAEETFGWASEDVVGEFNPIVQEKELDAFERLMNRLLDGEEVRGTEVVGQTKSGKRVEFMLSAAPIPGPDGPQSVTAVLSDITAQKRMERRLRELQETAQQLSVAPSIDAVGDIATGAANNVLGLSVTGLWRYDERKNALLPVTITTAAEDVVTSAPKFTAGNSLAWDAFEADEVRTYEDLWDIPERFNHDTNIRSEIIVPLGEEGIFITGSTEPRQFSKTDVELFRILGATVEAAMVRANREQQLRRQNERLEEFADVLAHDLRNPLTTAQGFLKLARESGNAEQFDRVETAHDRIGQLINDLLTLARGESVVTDPETVDIAEAADEAWLLVDTDDATLRMADPPTVDADPGRLRQLLENLFRNSVEHGVTGQQAQQAEGPAMSGEHETAPLTVTIGALADTKGFYVEDDGVGIPEEHRGAVLDHGVSFSEEGTGFGLSIVVDIARAHDWDLSLAESDAGGARFEFVPDHLQNT